MKTSNITIIILIVLCVLLGLILAMTLPCNCNERGSLPDSSTACLKAQNDSLVKSNTALDQQLLDYQVQADSLREKLLNTSDNIQQLKKQRHESNTRLDSLDSIELYGYFSEFKP